MRARLDLLVPSMSGDLVRVAEVSLVDTVSNAFRPRAASTVVMAKRISNGLLSVVSMRRHGRIVRETDAVAFLGASQDVATPFRDAVLELKLSIAFRVQPCLQRLKLCATLFSTARQQVEGQAEQTSSSVS